MEKNNTRLKWCTICQGHTMYKVRNHWTCLNCQIKLSKNEVKLNNENAKDPLSDASIRDNDSLNVFPYVPGPGWGEAIEIVKKHQDDPDYKEEMDLYKLIKHAVMTMKFDTSVEKREEALHDIRIAINAVLLSVLLRTEEERLVVLKRVFRVLETLATVPDVPLQRCYNLPGFIPSRDVTRAMRSKLLEDAASALESLERDRNTCWYLEEAQRLYVICLTHYYELIPPMRVHSIRVRYKSYFQKSISIRHYCQLRKHIQRLNALRRQIDSNCTLIEPPSFYIRYLDFIFFCKLMAAPVAIVLVWLYLAYKTGRLIWW